jgi:hypothetical protein
MYCSFMCGNRNAMEEYMKQAEFSGNSLQDASFAPPCEYGFPGILRQRKPHLLCRRKLE